MQATRDKDSRTAPKSRNQDQQNQAFLACTNLPAKSLTVETKTNNVQTIFGIWYLVFSICYLVFVI